AIASTDPVLLAWLAHAKAICGECGVARTILGGLESMRQGRFVSAYHLAFAFVGLGGADEAFRHADMALAERAPGVINLNRDPRFDPIRGDARFSVLLNRVHLG